MALESSSGDSVTLGDPLEVKVVCSSIGDANDVEEFPASQIASILDSYISSLPAREQTLFAKVPALTSPYVSPTPLIHP